MKGVGLMRAVLRLLHHLILSAMQDFSQEHSSICVSSCGVVCFDPREGLRDSGTEADPVEPLWNGVGVALRDVSAPVAGG